MATIMSIAKELNISRVRVYQIIANLPEDLQPKKIDGHYKLEDQDVKSIKQYFKKNSLKLKQNNNSENEYKFANKALQNEVETLKQQLTNKDTHIKDLTQLLDQSQQLQLVAENKIKQLEDKMDGEQTKNESTGEPGKSIGVDPSTKKSERGFWSRLFKR